MPSARPSHPFGPAVPQRTTNYNLHETDICPNARVAEVATSAAAAAKLRRNRGCFRDDGRAKRWYLSRANAKQVATKGQDVYRCASGEGFHIGNGT